MRRALLIWGLLLAGIICIAQSEHVSAFWQSRDSNYNIAISGGGGAYTGPANVVSGASYWYGLFAYNSADRGNALVNVCNSTGGIDIGCADLFSDATTGALVSATVSGITCPGINCTVKTAYDRSGANNCSGPCNLTQATVGARPSLLASQIGSLPALVCNGSAPSSLLLVSVTTLSVVQPFTISAVAEQTSVNTYATILTGKNNNEALSLIVRPIKS